MKLKIIIVSIFILIFLITFLVIYPYWIFIHQDLKISIIKTLLGKDNVKKYNDQVNILILGIASGNHDGPNLSDSINVINYNFKKNILSVISIPRDIWSDTLKNKINFAYAYGEFKKPNKGGFILAKAEISEIIGMPIHYASVISFKEFEELINYLGGIEVNVENSFIDKKFPIKGKENDNCNGDPNYKCRYETISFKKGKNYMNGETALKFIRSRNAEGEEGNDFARERRQQKVIEAIKDKLIVEIKKFNLNRYREIYYIFDKLIKKDISNQELAFIIKNIIIKRNLNYKKVILDESFFINPPLDSIKYKRLWVLLPKDKNYKKIHQYIRCELENEKNCEFLKQK